MNPLSKSAFDQNSDSENDSRLLPLPPHHLNQNNYKEHNSYDQKPRFLKSEINETMQTSRSIHFPQHPTFEVEEEEDNEKALLRKNNNLREELRALSAQLTSLLAKQKISKLEQSAKLSASSVTHNVNSEEIRLHLELETAQKQLAAYKKEFNQLQSKNDEFMDPMKRIQQTEKVFEAEERIEKETQNNRTINKLIREKGKEIERLQKEVSTGRREANMNDMIIAMNEKYKTAANNENKLKEQSYNKEVYITKLEEELQRLKDDHNFALERTGYVEPVKKDRAKANSVSRFKKIARENSGAQMTPRNASTAWRSKEDDQEEMNFNAENFSKLHSKLKIVKKSDAVKERTWKREMNNLHGEIMSHDKERQEAVTVLSEVEREVDKLNSVFKELNSISLRHTIQLPSQEKKFIKKLDNIEHGLLSARVRERIQLPQISARSNKSEKKPKMMELSRSEKQEDSEFNDRELIKDQNVKIVGMRIWYDGKRLNGVQATYKTGSGKKFEGKKHGRNLYKYRVAKFEMEGDDYLKDLNGYMSSDGASVICLVFKFASGEMRKVGQPKEKSRLFKFDVNDHEFPAIIYGSIIEEGNDSVLARLGVLIASEDEFPAAIEDENPDIVWDESIASAQVSSLFQPNKHVIRKEL